MRKARHPCGQIGDKQANRFKKHRKHQFQPYFNWISHKTAFVKYTIPLSRVTSFGDMKEIVSVLRFSRTQKKYMVTLSHHKKSVSQRENAFAQTIKS